MAGAVKKGGKKGRKLGRSLNSEAHKRYNAENRRVKNNPERKAVTARMARRTGKK